MKHINIRWKGKTSFKFEFLIHLRVFDSCVSFLKNSFFFFVELILLLLSDLMNPKNQRQKIMHQKDNSEIP